MPIKEELHKAANALSGRRPNIAKAIDLILTFAEIHGQLRGTLRNEGELIFATLDNEEFSFSVDAARHKLRMLLAAMAQSCKTIAVRRFLPASAKKVKQTMTPYGGTGVLKRGGDTILQAEIENTTDRQMFTISRVVPPSAAR